VNLPPLPAAEVADSFKAADEKWPASEALAPGKEFSRTSGQERKATTAGAPGWRAVAYGLGLMQFGSVLVLVAFVIHFVGLNRSRHPDREEIRLVYSLPVLLLLLGSLVAVIGGFLCACVPESSGLKTVALLGAIFNLVIPPAGFVLSMLFLRGVGKYLNNHKLASGALAYLVVALLTPFALCFLTAAWVVWAITSDPRNGEVPLAGVVGPILGPTLWMGGILLVVVWYLVLVGSARQAVSRATRRPPA
jgi:hypothetical protein